MTRTAPPALRAVSLAALASFCAPPWTAGCASPPTRPSFADEAYPGVLRAAGRLPQDLVWRQRVTASWGADESRGFDAVVQKRGDTLTVMGLSPLGTTGFAIVLRGSEVELVGDLPESLPFPPRFILLDVQRALYPWLPGAAGARPDGDHAAEVAGERVVETWRGGRLLERRFTRLDGEPAGVIRVAYAGGYAVGTPPPPLSLENGWFGYRLDVDTLAQDLLPAGGDERP